MPAETTIVAPSPTPFRENDAVDFDAVARNADRWAETTLSGVVLNSENGEEAFLSEDERLQIVRVVHGALAGRKFIMGGIDSPSVTETLRLAERLAEAGVKLIRIRIPRLIPNVADYFAAVAARAPLPVMVIHQMAPGRFLGAPAGIGASAEVLSEVVAHENVFGYIMSDNLRFEARLKAHLPEEKQFWVSNGSLLLSGGVLGATGACLMLGNVAPQQCHEILRCVAEGRLSEAQQVHERIVEADWQILSRGAAGIKAALDELGYDGGTPRAPGRACDEDDCRQIREALRQLR